jgi:hypothetical protein
MNTGSEFVRESSASRSDVSESKPGISIRREEEIIGISIGVSSMLRHNWAKSRGSSGRSINVKEVFGRPNSTQKVENNSGRSVDGTFSSELRLFATERSPRNAHSDEMTVSEVANERM